MRIAVDAMGGDHAPAAIVAGTVEAARAFPQQVTALHLVGDEKAVRGELDRLGDIPGSIRVVHASETVGMDEAPAVAIRRKKDSSIGRAVDLVKQGEAEAVFSAGNTGAAVAATTLKLRTLQGVERPAIATVIPSPEKPFILIDAGANPDCTPAQLAQIAVMGSAYSMAILGRSRPVVGLLSIGGEAAKGNEVTKEAFGLLAASQLNFLGNVESHDLFTGRVDVVVCDGFTGNVVLKTSESVARTMSRWVREEVTRNWWRKVGAFLLRPAFNSIRERSDSETYGGAPLLGVNGVCIIGHGSSSARAVRNAIRVASEWVSHDVNRLIVQGIAGLAANDPRPGEEKPWTA